MISAVQAFSWRSFARRGLAVSPAQAYAIRFGVTASVAIWIGKAPGLVENNSSWILITVLVLMQPTSGGSLLKALLRAAGTLAAGFTSILLFAVAQDPPLLMAGLFLVQAVAAYGFTGPRFQYAWYVWAFTTAIVLGDAIVGGGEVETLAFQRASMVGIGILLVFLADSLLWPTRAEPSLRASLSSRARYLGDALQGAIASQGETGSIDAPAPEPLASQLALVAAARSEIGVSAARAGALARVALLLDALASRVRALEEDRVRPEGGDAELKAFDAALAELGRRVVSALRELAGALSSARAPGRFSDELGEALLAFDAERDALIRRGGWSRALEGRAAGLRDLVEGLSEIEATLASEGGGRSTRATPAQWSFQVDPLRMKLALRVGIAVVGASLLVLALGWGFNGMVPSLVFMVSVATRGLATRSMPMLLAMLALGWLLADVSIVYLAPLLGRFPLALVLPFCLMASCAALASKHPPLALLPTVAGMIGLLSVFGGAATPTDVYGPYNLVCYVGMALALGVLAARVLWPIASSELLLERVARQLEACLETLRAARQAGDAGRAERVRSLVARFNSESAQLGPLHQQAEREPVERALDALRRAALLTLAVKLMDAVLGDRAGTSEALLGRGGAATQAALEALRREDEALLDSLRSLIAALRGDPTPTTSSLSEAHAAAQEELRSLATIPDAFPPLTDDDKRRLLVELDARRRLVLRQLAIEAWLADWREAEPGLALGNCDSCGPHQRSAGESP